MQLIVKTNKLYKEMARCQRCKKRFVVVKSKTAYISRTMCPECCNK